MDGQRLWKAALAGGLALAFTCAQGAGGIYTCVDGKGKRWTSDRYIPECSDREQKVMGPTGTVRAVVPPTLTAQERAVQDQVDKKAAEDAQRRNEEKRVQRALLSRYPNKASHDAERAKALHSMEGSAQDEEKKRVNARFDEELAQLQKLWVPASLAGAEASRR